MSAIPKVISDFFNSELSVWESAAKNYEDLKSMESKPFKTGHLNGIVVHNPARIKSVSAKIDSNFLKERKCFLCRENRPSNQGSLALFDEWEILVNPFPVCPLHFTISNKNHIPQEEIPEDIINIASKFSGMVVFFNGAKSGASAPDHCHMQAIPKEYVPLIKLVEEKHRENKKGFFWSDDLNIDIPFSFISGIFEKEENLSSIISQFITKENFSLDHSMINALVWETDSKEIRIIVIPRSAHRPDSYYKEGKEKLLVSPASLEMGGIIICPRKEDYEKINDETIIEIYKQVGISK